MSRPFLRPALVFVLLLLAVSVGAQERGQVGLSAGYPTSIAIIWHVSDAVAFRPEVSFSRTDTSHEGAGSVGEADTWGISAGGSLLFTVGRWDDLRAYVAPRLVYSRTESDSGSYNTTSSAYQATASFGVQQRVSKRLSLFAELGLAYTRQESRFDAPIYLPVEALVEYDSKTKGNAWGPRSAIGLVWYF